MKLKREINSEQLEQLRTAITNATGEVHLLIKPANVIAVITTDDNDVITQAKARGFVEQ
jgi:hypothetical protein